MKYKYTKEQLEEIVPKVLSMRALLLELGIAYTGGNFSHMKKRLEKEGISTKHFLGQRAGKGVQNTKRLTPEQILVESVERVKADKLRRALVESGVGYKCVTCGISDWNNASITLHVDHIDGNSLDNRIENLRFLCPNCHSQTPTFSGRKNKQTKSHTCTDCGNIIARRSTRCTSCAATVRNRTRKTNAGVASERYNNTA